MMVAKMFGRVTLKSVLGIAIRATAIGCGKGSPKDTSDWTYNPPEEFKQQDQQKNGATVFLGPVDDGFKANLQVRAGTNSNQSAEQIGQDDLNKMKSDPDISVKEQEPYSLADSDSYTWLISKKLKNGNIAEQRQFIVKKNDVAVLFTLTSSEQSMSKWDQVLADSLKSFKWGRS